MVAISIVVHKLVLPRPAKISLKWALEFSFCSASGSHASPWPAHWLSHDDDDPSKYHCVVPVLYHEMVLVLVLVMVVLGVLVVDFVVVSGIQLSAPVAMSAPDPSQWATQESGL